MLDYIDRQELVARRPAITLTLPLQPNVYARLEYRHPMTGGEWDQMMHMLETMKPGMAND